jgi:hypothetical protein
MNEILLASTRLTFGEPEKTSLKTSFQEFVSLRSATGTSHPDPVRDSQYNQSKNPLKREGFYFGGATGTRTPDPLLAKQVL